LAEIASDVQFEDHRVSRFASKRRPRRRAADPRTAWLRAGGWFMMSSEI
jgi:hypothetical protein